MAGGRKEADRSEQVMLRQVAMLHCPGPPYVPTLPSNLRLREARGGGEIRNHHSFTFLDVTYSTFPERFSNLSRGCKYILKKNNTTASASIKAKRLQLNNFKPSCVSYGLCIQTWESAGCFCFAAPRRGGREPGGGGRGGGGGEGERTVEG